jgi:hypothetical protein
MADMPRDPDYDDVPTELAALEGRQVLVMGRDTWTGQPVAEQGMVVIVPGLWGDLRRKAEDG